MLLDKPDLEERKKKDWKTNGRPWWIGRQRWIGRKCD